MYGSFEELISKKMSHDYQKKTIVVAGSQDEHVLEAVFLASEKGYVNVLLVGDEEKTLQIIKELGYEKAPYKMVGISPEENPSAKAVELIRGGEGDFIIKGKMETKDLLRPILNKEKGLNKGGFITHLGVMQIEGYDRLLFMSDSAVIPYPTLEQKTRIAQEGLEAMKKLGYENPVVGALCAVETVSDKMPETTDAEKLQELSEKGEIDGIVVGPISFDLATSQESVAIKGYKSPYGAKVDMFLVPQMVTGNVMSKIWNVNPKNILAGCLVGADVPIALTSRSASMSEKLHSIILCALLS